MCIAALSLIGSVVSGVGAAMGASAQAASHRAAAQAQRRQADIERISGSYQSQRKQEQVDRVIGQQRADYASGGIALTGGAADTIQDSATEGALDVAAIRWGSGMQAQTHEYNARVEDMNAKSAQRSAPIAFLTPVLSGVAKFGQSFGSLGG
ncbi:MAG: hypothetical protein WCY29_06105 [Novosphingobium sp.]